MDVRSYEARKDKKWKNKRDNESGGNLKGSAGKEVAGKEVEVMSGTLRRKESDEIKVQGRGKRGRPKRRWLNNVKDDIKQIQRGTT